MEEYPGRESADAPTGKRLTLIGDWRVLALSLAGLLFILLGLAVLLVPASQEGTLLLYLDPNHALHWLDVAGVLVAGLGVVLAWLGGMLWQKTLVT